jgi:4-diphosphocytidyl-2-C-methyl-D-erythritol kinase
MVTIYRAHAKLTTRLRVAGVRADGYHLIDAEMVSLDLHDTLEITDGDGLDITGGLLGDAATGLFVPDTAGDNLISAALRLVDRRARVRLTKAIAPGAGLGGGSADAAAVLVWAGFDDLLAAGGLGADVPFCVVGGRARMTGIGEILEPLPFEERSYTLLTPPFGCSTPAVYRRWDEMGEPTGERGNDLEPAALDVEPRLGEWRDRLEQATGQRARLAGSGSTWFVEGAFPGDGLVVAHTVSTGVSTV